MITCQSAPTTTTIEGRAITGSSYAVRTLRVTGWFILTTMLGEVAG